jgi:hypothetical protein
MKFFYFRKRVKLVHYFHVVLRLRISGALLHIFHGLHLYAIVLRYSKTPVLFGWLSCFSFRRPRVGISVSILIVTADMFIGRAMAQAVVVAFAPTPVHVTLLAVRVKP